MKALLPLVVLASSLCLADSPARRDPFARPAGVDVERPRSRCTTSLCRQEVADLKLVAVVARGPQSVAMFEDRAGQGFVARRNTEVGGKGARVSLIDLECVTLMSFVPAADGRVQAVKERLCVPGADAPHDHDYLRDGPYTP